MTYDFAMGTDGQTGFNAPQSKIEAAVNYWISQGKQPNILFKKNYLSLVNMKVLLLQNSCLGLDSMDVPSSYQIPHNIHQDRQVLVPVPRDLTPVRLGIWVTMRYA